MLSPGRLSHRSAISQQRSDTVELWLSSLIVETLSLLTGLLTGRARFDNTGAVGRGPGWRVYHANHPLVHLAEVAAGAWFLERAWALANPWLAVPGFALLTAPLVVRAGWDCRPVRWLALLPLLTGLAMLALTLRELWCSSRVAGSFRR